MAQGRFRETERDGMCRHRVQIRRLHRVPDTDDNRICRKRMTDHSIGASSRGHDLSDAGGHGIFGTRTHLALVLALRGAPVLSSLPGPLG